MTNLVTIGDYKRYKGIRSEDNDPTISLLIAAVSDFVANYTGRNFLKYANTDKIEYFNALANHYYMPEEFPLLSVSEVAVSTDGGVTFTTLVENTDYFVDTDNDMIISNTGYPNFVYATNIGFHSGKITYRAGYNTIPNDLKIAVLDLVHYYIKEEYTPSKSLQSANVQNAVVLIEGSKLPPHVRRVLDNYRV